MDPLLKIEGHAPPAVFYPPDKALDFYTARDTHLTFKAKAVMTIAALGSPGNVTKIS